MELVDVLNRESVIPNLVSTTKTDVIRELSEKVLDDVNSDAYSIILALTPIEVPEKMHKSFIAGSVLEARSAIKQQQKRK